MVMLSISHSDLNHALGEKISIEELEQTLFNMGFELDDVNDDELSIEITAERLDLISLQGLARAIKIFNKKAKATTQYELYDEGYEVIVDPKIKEIRPYTVCAVIKNLKLDEEKLIQIINVQEKLHLLLARNRSKGAIGIYPLETIKMPITYTADTPDKIKFVPLGEFKEMTGSEILSEHETGKEYGHLLEGKKMYPYFIDSNKEILSMPPIINSEKTGRVTEETKELFIECSGFDKVLLNEMLTNIVTMFHEMSGQICKVDVKYKEGTEMLPLVAPYRIIVQKETIRNLLSLELGDKKLTELLEQMMYKVLKIDKEKIEVEAPCYRRDLWHEIDVADDIARAYGYNNFELIVPNISTIGGTLSLSDLKEEIATGMVGLGHLETYTETLVNKKEHIKFMKLENVEHIPVINGSESQTMMRVSMIPELLNCFVNNKSNSLPQKIFEVGFVVIPDKDKDVLCKNQMNLCAMITNSSATFTQIKQVLDAILKTKGIECEIKKTKHPSFIDGRAGEIIINKKIVGIIGEIHPQVLTNFKLSNPVCCFEINLENINF